MTPINRRTYDQSLRDQQDLSTPTPLTRADGAWMAVLCGVIAAMVVRVVELLSI
jgi:hypothetical protein